MVKNKTGPVGIVKSDSSELDSMTDREILLRHIENDRSDFQSLRSEIRGAAKKQNWFLSAVIAIATAIGAAIHGYLG